MDSTSTVCPVCTLFLRPGITLKDHLSSHPKHKVIEALVKLSSVPDSPKLPASPPESVVSTSPTNTAVVNSQTWNQQPQGQVSGNPTIQPVPGNHVFIYQQSMSTTTPQGNVLNVNPLSQQYVYPTVFNPQMMPYVYQQQQVIMSSNSLPTNIRALPPFELPNTSPANNSELTVDATTEGVLSDDEGDKHSDHVEDVLKDPEETCQMEVKKQEACADNINIEEVKTIDDFENQDERFEEIHSETYPIEGSSPEHNCSPHSQTHSEWTFHSDLNKACQTHLLNNSSPKSQTVEDDRIEDSHCITETPNHSDYSYEEHPSNQYQQENNCFDQQTVNVPFTTVKMNVDTFEQSEPIYTSANILHGSDNMEFVNMDEVVIIGDFSTNHLISRVENFENTLPDRSRVLMTIGSLDEHVKDDFNDHRDPDESMSRGSSHLNIRSDERMPARGELSGQESMGGASDITWNRLQYQEGSSRMCNSYDLMERDRWDGSDSDSVDSPSTPRRDSTSVPYYDDDIDNENDTPTIVSYSGPPMNFKCPICGEDFATSKDRKAHELDKHPERNNKNIIGLDIGKKKVKKLVVKPKAQVSNVEQSFNTVFTNKLKQENLIDIQETKLQEDQNLKQDDSESIVPLDSAAVSKCIKTVCPICDGVFENANDLKQHKQEAHQELVKTKNKCSTCNEVFPNDYRYTEHLKIHPLECRLCGKLFYRKQNLQLHMKRHLGLKPYKCEICQKSFVTRQKHDEHKTVHTGEAPIKCTLCDEKFRRHSNLVEHRNRHHYQLKKKLKDYICHCGEIFHSKKKLAWHKETHEVKPKACTECNEKFLHMSSLTRHMRRAHNQKFLPEEARQNENVECPVCKGTFLKSSLDVHIRNHSGERPFQCLICNKDFTTKWNLKLHKWTHASRTTKPFKCDQCKGAFIRESDYIAHMNSHKSVRPYTCNYCGAKFIRKYNCLRHVKEHESNKRYACNVCGKSFHRSYYLKDHMRVHSGIRPYTCHICGKTSATKSNHNKHVQIHHAREPVSTEN